MAHDLLVCSRCGNLRSECGDPTIDWHPNESTCYASASREWGWRKLREKYKDDPPGTQGLHDLDGVAVYTTRDAPEVDLFA